MIVTITDTITITNTININNTILLKGGYWILTAPKTHPLYHIMDNTVLRWSVNRCLLDHEKQDAFWEAVHQIFRASVCFTHSVFVRDGVLVKTWQVFSGPQICDRVIYVCNLSSDTTPLLPLTAIIIVVIILIPVVILIILIIFIIIKTRPKSLLSFLIKMIRNACISSHSPQRQHWKQKTTIMLFYHKLQTKQNKT